MEVSKEQCAARGGQRAVGRSRHGSCRNPQPTVASHENQEAQCHEQLLVPPPAPLQWSRNPQQRAEDGDAGQCQVQLESPSWRNFLAHFGWEESEWLVPEQKLSVAEAIEAYTVGSGYAEFEKQEKGLITLGKLVDRVPISRSRILDRAGKNPRRSSSQNICRVKIDLRCRCNREVTMVRTEVSEPKS